MRVGRANQEFIRPCRRIKISTLLGLDAALSSATPPVPRFRALWITADVCDARENERGRASADGEGGGGPVTPGYKMFFVFCLPAELRWTRGESGRINPLQRINVHAACAPSFVEGVSSVFFFFFCPAIFVVPIWISNRAYADSRQRVVNVTLACSRTVDAINGGQISAPVLQVDGNRYRGFRNIFALAHPLSINR